MNKGAGTLLATIVAISLFANSNAPRQAPPRRAGAGADNQRAAPVVAEKSEAPRWTPPPPDPRCFLLKTISGFYGHGNSIPTGAYSNAEELKGCAPGERWGLSCDEASHIHFVIATVPDPFSLIAALTPYRKPPRRKVGSLGLGGCPGIAASTLSPQTWTCASRSSLIKSREKVFPGS